ncbi:MAG: DUF1990 domain-containing protein [Vicinamibacteria bacterium]
MILRWARRANQVELDRARWEASPCSTSNADARLGTFRRSSIDLAVPSWLSSDEVWDRAVTELRRYEIFPPERMRFSICTSDHRVAENATIVQQVTFGPVALVTAVRVTNLFDSSSDTERRSGFTYATLKGHPERGTATFQIVHDLETASLKFVIETWSRPGTWLARIGGPVTRAIQRRMTQQALIYFQSMVAEFFEQAHGLPDEAAVHRSHQPMSSAVYGLRWPDIEVAAPALAGVLGVEWRLRDSSYRCGEYFLYRSAKGQPQEEMVLQTNCLEDDGESHEPEGADFPTVLYLSTPRLDELDTRLRDRLGVEVRLLRRRD